MILTLYILPPSACFQFRDLLCWMWPLDVRCPPMDLLSFHLSSLFLNPDKTLHPFHLMARSATDQVSAVLESFPFICSERGSCQLYLIHPSSCIGQNGEQSIAFRSLHVTHHHSVDVLDFSFRHLFFFPLTKESPLFNHFYIGAIF